MGSTNIKTKYQKYKANDNQALIKIAYLFLYGIEIILNYYKLDGKTS